MAGLTRPDGSDPSDQDPTAQVARGRGRGQRCAAASGGAQRIRRWGAPNSTGKHRNEEHAHANSTGGLRGGNNGARRRTAADRGGASLASTCRRCRARGRERAALDASSPPREAPGGLLVDGQAAAERSCGGDAARVRRRCSARRGLGFRGEGGGAVRGGGLYRPGEACLARGPAEKAARRGNRSRTRVRLGLGARREMTGRARPSARNP
jgi:hypothetical protein